MNDRFENINIESFDYPILVADESLFIIGKNSAAGEYNIRFRAGASLKNYLSAYDFKRIEELEKHDTLFITSINNTEDFFIIYRAEKAYYVIYATMIRILDSKIEEFCKNENLVKTYFNHVIGNDYNGSNTETNNKKMRFISRLKRHYALFNELFFGESLFPLNDEDICLAISYAFKKLESLLNKENKVIFLDNRVDKPLVAKFIPSDISLVLSSLIVIACALKEKGNVCCSVDYFDDELVVSIGFIGGLKCDYNKLLFSFEEATSSPYCIEMFELVLLKRICENNGWRLKYSLFSDKSNQIFKLFIPCKETVYLKMSSDSWIFELVSRIIDDEFAFYI